MSDSLNVGTGIGQGTVLGLPVFVFYINDVTKNIADLHINTYVNLFLHFDARLLSLEQRRQVQLMYLILMVRIHNPESEVCTKMFAFINSTFRHKVAFVRST